MKSKLAIACAAAALSLTSFAASAADTDSVRACMESFVAQNFPDRVVSFQVKNDRTALPLIASTGTRSVELIATGKTSGRVIATATCKVKEGGREGNVSVGPLTTT
jgi:hypothetical protein